MGKTYDNDSLGRGLDVHKMNGIVADWKPPVEGRPTWLIYFHSASAIPTAFTAAQVFAFCVGCTETTKALTGKSSWEMAHGATT